MTHAQLREVQGDLEAYIQPRLKEAFDILEALELVRCPSLGGYAAEFESYYVEDGLFHLYGEAIGRYEDDDDAHKSDYYVKVADLDMDSWDAWKQKQAARTAEASRKQAARREAREQRARAQRLRQYERLRAEFDC